MTLGTMLRIVGFGRVPLDQHPMPLCLVEQRREFGFLRLGSEARGQLLVEGAWRHRI